MKEFVKIFSFDLKEYDQWQINWAQEDQWLIAIFFGLMAPLALWFFWTSLGRIGSTLKKFFMSIQEVPQVILLLELLKHIHKTKILLSWNKDIMEIHPVE